jgi:ABC-type molybdenum transport system ATPase subunit/photorepair protein PhrA
VVSLLRVLVARPAIFILDEATASIDIYRVADPAGLDLIWLTQPAS